MMTPSERALRSPALEVMAKYYQGASVSAADCIQLFRLAWDIVGESFGTRQQLYERYYAGDPVHTTTPRYVDYDKRTAIDRVEALLQASRRSEGR